MINFISNGGYKSFLFNTVSALIALGSGAILGWEIFHGQTPNPTAIGVISAYTGYQFGNYLNTSEKKAP